MCVVAFLLVLMGQWRCRVSRLGSSLGPNAWLVDYPRSSADSYRPQQLESIYVPPCQWSIGLQCRRRWGRGILSWRTSFVCLKGQCRMPQHIISEMILVMELRKSGVAQLPIVVVCFLSWLRDQHRPLLVGVWVLPMILLCQTPMLNPFTQQDAVSKRQSGVLFMPQHPVTKPTSDGGGIF